MSRKPTRVVFHGSFAELVVILFSTVFKVPPEIVVDKWDRIERKATRSELK